MLHLRRTGEIQRRRQKMAPFVSRELRSSEELNPKHRKLQAGQEHTQPISCYLGVRRDLTIAILHRLHRKQVLLSYPGKEWRLLCRVSHICSTVLAWLYSIGHMLTKPASLYVRPSSQKPLVKTLFCPKELKLSFRPPSAHQALLLVHCWC